MILLDGLAGLAAAAALVGAGYQIAAARLVGRFARATPPEPSARPPLSLLKPLCGAEPGMDKTLATALDQDYPAFQVVFGVADPADPALEVVRGLAVPAGVSLDIVVDPRRHGRNLKVGNLINMMAKARHEVIVVADSDIRVDRHALSDLVAPFADPGVGVVTALYVAEPGAGVWSRLAALAINHGFLPSALVARALGRTDGCFGASIAIRRAVLEQGGGFDSIADLLADDWALGALARAQGYRIALAARPVGAVVHEPSLRALIDHEVRWARTIAAIDRPSYVASVITLPVPLALLALLLSGGAAWAAGLFAATLLARTGAGWAQARALRLPRPGVGVLLARDVVSLVVYGVAISGRSVVWRGRRFRVRRDGTLDPVEG
jgi:ceramide glucosyltransferase